jgi:hypothetical protein
VEYQSPVFFFTHSLLVVVFDDKPWTFLISPCVSDVRHATFSYYFFTLLLPSYLLVLSYYFFRPLYVTLHNNKYRGSELYIPSVCACVQFVWTGRQRPALESVQYRTNQIYICSFRIWTQALSVSLNLCCMTRAQFYISPIPPFYHKSGVL